MDPHEDRGVGQDRLLQAGQEGGVHFLALWTLHGLWVMLLPVFKAFTTL